MSKNEIRDGRECVVNMIHEKGEILVQRSTDDVPKQFTFDSVYDWNSKQENVFVEVAYPIIENVMEGYNGTIFAYGQTGTGKTFTISGMPKDHDLKGIMPRTFETVFKSIECDTKK
jgi:kinesin family protein 3/17